MHLPDVPPAGLVRKLAAETLDQIAELLGVLAQMLGLGFSVNSKPVPLCLAPWSMHRRRRRFRRHRTGYDFPHGVVALHSQHHRQREDGGRRSQRANDRRPASGRSWHQDCSAGHRRVPQRASPGFPPLTFVDPCVDPGSSARRHHVERVDHPLQLGLAGLQLLSHEGDVGAGRFDRELVATPLTASGAENHVCVALLVTRPTGNITQTWSGFGESAKIG